MCETQRFKRLRNTWSSVDGREDLLLLISVCPALLVPGELHLKPICDTIAWTTTVKASLTFFIP